jgi:hypothetical protein
MLNNMDVYDIYDIYFHQKGWVICKDGDPDQDPIPDVRIQTKRSYWIWIRNTGVTYIMWLIFFFIPMNYFVINTVNLNFCFPVTILLV